MKKNLHPLIKDCTVKCDCGETFKTKSTKEEIHVESCYKCHPFYTGTQGKLRKQGNIAKFNKKYNFETKEK